MGNAKGYNKRVIEFPEGSQFLTNREILDQTMTLLDDCIYYQFARLVREGQGWKTEFQEDLRNDLVVFILTYDNRKLNHAWCHHHMNALYTRMIQNQLWSSSSLFYTNYIKFREKSDDLNEYGKASIDIDENGQVKTIPDQDEDRGGIFDS